MPELIAALARQKEEERQAKIVARARKMVARFRPKKSDRGRYVFVGVRGSRDAARKGRRGVAVYVDQKGRKHLTLSVGQKGATVKITDLNLPVVRGRKRAYKQFIASRRELLAGGEALVKGSGSITIDSVNDFGTPIIVRLAKHLKKVMEGQRGQRKFILNARVLVSLRGGREKVYEVEVPIARPDHVSIKLGGLQNFIRLKFYAIMARQLAFDGYVTSGSSNHIRRLPENQGVDRDEWTKGEDLWEGHDYEVVRIRRIQWQIEQQV